MADPVEIPIPEDVPLFSERITLDGIEYLFEFDYSEREFRWYLTIKNLTGDTLATGIKIVANWPLLRQYSDPRLPAGTLTAVDLSPLEGEPPVYEELGVRVKLMYLPK